MGLMPLIRTTSSRFSFFDTVAHYTEQEDNEYKNKNKNKNENETHLFYVSICGFYNGYNIP